MAAADARLSTTSSDDSATTNARRLTRILGHARRARTFVAAAAPRPRRRRASASKARSRTSTPCSARTREPVVVFTEFRHSLEVLRAAPGPSASARGDLHGGQTDLERRQQLDRFSTARPRCCWRPTSPARASTCSRARAGSSASNCHGIQRGSSSASGRVDRIGQTRGVHATLLVARHDAEAGLLANLARRTLAARRRSATTLLDIGSAGRTTLARALIEHAAAGASWRRRRGQSSIVSTWQRHARVARAAAAIVATLVQRWRRASEGGTAAWRVSARWPRLGLPPGRRDSLVFTVPVLDRAGTVVERHVVALAAEATRSISTTSASVIAHGRRLAALVAIAPVRGVRLGSCVAPRTSGIRQATARSSPGSSGIGFRPKRSPDCSTGANSRRSRPRRSPGSGSETMRPKRRQLATARANSTSDVRCSSWS